MCVCVCVCVQTARFSIDTIYVYVVGYQKPHTVVMHTADNHLCTQTSDGASTLSLVRGLFSNSHSTTMLWLVATAW